MYFWFMANLDHMYRKRHPHTSFWRSLPGSAGGIGCPLASSAIGPYSYEKVLVDGGFITAADMRYHFLVTDHLGNVRVVVNDAGLVEQVNQFYPYGEATDMGQALPASGASGAQLINASSIEKQSEAIVDIGVGLMSFIPGAGPFISLYWTLLGKHVYYEYTLPNIINGQPIKLPEPY